VSKIHKKHQKLDQSAISIRMGLAVTFILGGIIGGAISHVHLMNGSFQKIEQRPLIDPLECNLYQYSLDSVSSKVADELITLHKNEYNAIRKVMPAQRIYFESIFRDTTGNSKMLYLLKVHRAGGNSTPPVLLDVHRKLDSLSHGIFKDNLKNSMRAEIMYLPDFIEKAVSGAQHEAEP